MQEFNTNLYTLTRKDDGTLIRIDGLGGETPEMTQEYYESQIAYHEQVIANLEAQRAKVVEFEGEEPVVEVAEVPKPEASHVEE